MITFKVDDVTARQDHPMRRYASDKAQFLKQGLAKVGIRGDTVEAHKFNAEEIQFHSVSQNSFVRTVLGAYNGHHPLAISPDDLWLVISQAAAKHISLYPEECRRALVSWEGKKVIEVRNADFVKGSPDNDWEREFAKFSDLIADAIGKKRDLFDPTFSTTTPTEKVAIQIQMMAALAPYMEYRMMTCCGIPSMTLLGEVTDWWEINKRVDALGEFYPKWAHEPMMRAVGHFVQAAAGNPDLSFWKNLAKQSGGSGGTYINGWINAFFPYVDKNKPNKMMANGGFAEAVLKDPRSGLEIGDYPGSTAMVPMHWNCNGTPYEMGLASGIVGTTLTEVDGVKAYKCAIGWAVGEAKSSTEHAEFIKADMDEEDDE